MKKYLLLLLVCVGCSAPPAKQQVVSKTPKKTFHATVLTVADGPPSLAVVRMANGGLFSLVEPFDQITETKAKLEVGQELVVEYVDVFITHFTDGKLAYTTVAKPTYEIQRVELEVKVDPEFNDLFK